MDIQLRKKRNHQAAYTFMKRLIKTFGKPTFLTIEKTHCTIKHLNNLIEQEHRHVKRRFAKSARFQNIRHASLTIKRIEAIHVLYKQRRSLQADSAFSVYHELQ
ncbi:Transposase for insertion sequence element IS257 in transposon Tn4003 [Bacillus mycoides]|nr:Transposase for insertion sequence element IS257 in transposon Tn4003 [Bacillus mycoides]GAE43326.1 putative transposase [Bacillus mycoides NBRC 101238 = DSM 11821]